MTILPSRRALLGGLAAAPLAALAAGPIRPAAAAATTAVPPVASLKLGRVTVHFLSDGYVDSPIGWWTGAPGEEIARRVAALDGGDGTSLRLNFTAWLVDDGERLTLIDAGGPPGALPHNGRLPAALRALGVAPERIGLVAATHTHFDHIGGMLKDGRAVFPQAELLLPRADVAHFTDPARAAAAPDFLKSSFDLTASLLRAYPRVQQVDGERALTPFISSVDMAGHTPGHTGFRISDGGRTLLITGDLLFAPALHPAREDLGIAFETDPAAALAMRRRFFARAEEEKALLAATHMPFPGLGRIIREGGTRRWVTDRFPQDA